MIEEGSLLDNAYFWGLSSSSSTSLSFCTRDQTGFSFISKPVFYMFFTCVHLLVWYQQISGYSIDFKVRSSTTTFTRWQSISALHILCSSAAPSPCRGRSLRGHGCFLIRNNTLSAVCVQSMYAVWDNGHFCHSRPVDDWDPHCSWRIIYYELQWTNICVNWM